MNGKTVEIDNTDAEGRLVLSGFQAGFVCRCIGSLTAPVLLADALYYTSTEYKPHTLIDVATLTGCVVFSFNAATNILQTSGCYPLSLEVPWSLRSERFTLVSSLYESTFA